MISKEVKELSIKWNFLKMKNKAMMSRESVKPVIAPLILGVWPTKSALFGQENTTVIFTPKT